MCIFQSSFLKMKYHLLEILKYSHPTTLYSLIYIPILFSSVVFLVVFLSFDSNKIGSRSSLFEGEIVIKK